MFESSNVQSTDSFVTGLVDDRNANENLSTNK